MVGSNDFMCGLEHAVDVAPLALTRTWTRGWYRLRSQDGEGAAGDIELGFLARHNPELVEPPLEPEGDGE